MSDTKHYRIRLYIFHDLPHLPPFVDRLVEVIGVDNLIKELWNFSSEVKDNKEAKEYFNKWVNDFILELRERDGFFDPVHYNFTMKKAIFIDIKKNQ